jgi:hypothetical protein
MSSFSIDSGADVMKRLFFTALLAVFLSMIVGGCYTKLKGPEPSTGETTYDNNYDNYPYPYGYYSPYYFHDGWYSPYFLGSPYYYGNFYSPWWYDPFYYYGDGQNNGNGRFPSGKDIRRRRGDNGSLPPVPGATYSPPSTPPPNSGGQGYQPPPQSPPKENPPADNGNSNNGGKSTRQRR